MSNSNRNYFKINGVSEQTKKHAKLMAEHKGFTTVGAMLKSILIEEISTYCNSHKLS